MTGQDLFGAMSEIDDALVAEGEEELPAVGRGVWKRWAALAACVAIVVAGLAVTRWMSGENKPPMEMVGTSIAASDDSYEEGESSSSAPVTTPTATAPKASQSENPAVSKTVSVKSVMVGVVNSATTTASTTVTAGKPHTMASRSQSTIRSTGTTAPQLGQQAEQQLLQDYREMRRQAAAKPTTTTTTTYDPIPDEPCAPGQPGDSFPVGTEGEYAPDALFDETVPVYIHRCLGTYRGAAVVMIGGDKALYTDAPQTVVIAGVTLTIPAGPPVLVYKEGVFRTLESAWRWGWLEPGDLEQICRLLNG